MKGKLIIWLVVLLAVFLLGFIPQYQKARRLSQELDTAKSDLASCRLDGEMSEARDLAAMTYLEANRKNYGIAGGHARKLFDLLQKLSGETAQPDLKRRLSELLAFRDDITAGLASGDPAVLAAIEALALKIHEGALR